MTVAPPTCRAEHSLPCRSPPRTAATYAWRLSPRAAGCSSSTRSPGTRPPTSRTAGTASPGARGCSQEACGFRDNLDALRAEGVDRVLALSSDRADYQQALVERLHLPYPMLSDPRLTLADELRLPTFEADGQTLYRRLTLVLRGATIEHVFYPVFPPDTHADEVVRWFRDHRDA
ncbi:redoxin domain-containing protein [Streptomyces sp. NPDC006906]|uniref:redoxin domain-containing protein n=1 Tax=Streptomyces sp. NPDC006906 TaxID=3154782 RepID=UPI0033C064EF